MGPISLAKSGWMIIAAICATGGLFGVAALVNRTSQSKVVLTTAKTRREKLTVSSGRPVAEAVWELEKRYAWAITYEDPVYIHDSEVTDVTSQVRRDLEKYKPGAAPKVLVPKGGELSVTFDVNADSGMPVDPPESIVQQIFDANAAAGYPGRFLLHSDGPFLHVIPTAYKDRHGVEMPRKSVLDTPISIASERRNSLQSLELLCAAVSQTTQTKMELGTFDANLFRASEDEIGAHGENARAFLMKILETTNQPLSWRLLYDPTVQTYSLNIHRLSR